MSSSPRTKGSSPPALLLVCLPGGGAETSARAVARALDSKGWNVALLVVSLSQPGTIQGADGEVKQLVGRPGNLHYWLRRLLPCSRRWAGVLRGLEAALFVQKMARRLALPGEALIDSPEGLNFPRGRRRRYPVCVTLHSSAFCWKENLGLPLNAADRCDKAAARRQLLAAARIYAPSRAVALHAQQSLGLTMERLDVFPYLVDEELLRRPVSESASSEVRILHVGRPSLWKGANYLVDAIPSVVQQCPRAVFTFAGWSAQDPEAAAMLAALPEQLVQGHVRMLGFVPHDEVIGYYDQADISVVPSLWDNSPFTVYEAMARGCAVVASAVGGIPELVFDGDGGLLVPPKDSRALAEAIISLAKDRAFLQHQKQRSRERAVEVFEPGLILKKQIEYYREAWEQRAP